MSFADKVSSIRIILIPIFVSLLIYSCSHPFLKNIAAFIFLLGILTDFLDGLVARIKKEKSDLGKIIDPLADKLLLLTAFISLYLLRGGLSLHFSIPLWVVLIVASRDIIILLGVAVLHLLKKEISMTPTIWGKLTTFFQMATVLAVLLETRFSPFIWKLAALFTLISGIDYFIRGIKEANTPELEK